MLSRLRRDTQGAVMVMAAFTLTILLLFAGLALDFGRAHLLRAQLQTAVDAASLAGALQVVPMVELHINRQRNVSYTCPDPVTGKPSTCWEWEDASDLSLEGPKWDLITHDNWRAKAGSRCNWPYSCDPPTITREWLVLPASTIPVAEATFATNAQWPGGRLKPQVLNLRVTTNTSTVKVTATADMVMPTTFLRLVGINEIRFTRSGTATPVKR